MKAALAVLTSQYDQKMMMKEIKQTYSKIVMLYSDSEAEAV
jgi:hypothetical protein